MDSAAQVGSGWSSALYQTSGEAVTQAHSQYEARSGQEEAVRTILYSVHETSSKSELEDDRYVAHNDPCSAAESVYKNSFLDLLMEIHGIL